MAPGQGPLPNNSKPSGPDHIHEIRQPFLTLQYPEMGIWELGISAVVPSGALEMQAGMRKSHAGAQQKQLGLEHSRAGAKDKHAGLLNSRAGLRKK